MQKYLELWSISISLLEYFLKKDPSGKYLSFIILFVWIWTTFSILATMIVLSKDSDYYQLVPRSLLFSLFLRFLISFCSSLIIWSLGSCSTFITGLLFTDLVVWAYFNVESVSSKFVSDGERQAIIIVRAFPPRESWKHKIRNLMEQRQCLKVLTFGYDF